MKRLSIYIVFLIAINNNFSLISMFRNSSMNLSEQDYQVPKVENSKHKKFKVFSCFCDSSLKLITLSFIVVTAISGYIIVKQMAQGCQEMDTACNQCSSKLEDAEDTVALAKKAAELIISVLENCPNHKDEIINNFLLNFEDLFKKCCSK